MPPPAQLGREFVPNQQRQDQPPAQIQKNLEKAFQEKEAVLEKSGKGFLEGLKALGDESGTPNDGRSKEGSHPAVAKETKSQKPKDRTAQEISKAPEEGQAKPLGDPLEELEKLSETTENAEEQAEVQPEEKVAAKEAEAKVKDESKEKEKYKWGELKEKANKLDTELPKLEKRIKEFEEKEKQFQAKEARLAELEKQYEEAQTKIAAVDILESPEYKENVSVPFQERMDYMKKVSDAYTLPWAELLRAMENPDEVLRDREFDAIMRNSEQTIPQVTQANLSRAASELVEIRKHGEYLEKNAKQALEAMKVEREAKETQQKEQTKAEKQQTALAVFSRMQKSIAELADESPETWVKEYAMAEHNPSIQIAQTYALAALPKVLQSHKAKVAEMQAKIEKLEKTLKARSNGSPQVEPQNGSVQIDTKDDRPFGERLAKL